MKHTNDTLLRSVASRLKQIRIERGLTQEVVTDRTKVNVGLYEVGTTNITIVLLTVLCNFYNVTLEEFFKGIEYEKAWRLIFFVKIRWFEIHKPHIGRFDCPTINGNPGTAQSYERVCSAQYGFGYFRLWKQSKIPLFGVYRQILQILQYLAWEIFRGDNLSGGAAGIAASANCRNRYFLGV